MIQQTNERLPPVTAMLGLPQPWPTLLGVLHRQHPQLNTRRAYFKAVEGCAAWCEDKGLGNLAWVNPMHVAAYVEQLDRTHSKPTVKQHLAAIRMLFDWLVTGHIMEISACTVPVLP